jgi:NAD-dependent deacetylase
VWFGEMLPREQMELAFERAQDSDIMFVIGTSAIVQPAASIPIIGKQSGATIIEVNLEPTPLTGLVDHSFLGKAGKVLPDLWKFVTK